MDVCVWVTAVYESLSPGTWRELSIGDCEPLEIEGSEEAKPIRERASVNHDSRLDQTNFAERTISGNRIGVGIEEYTVRADFNGGRRLTLKGTSSAHQ
jgi:hypothetical protein